jgi:hypothetical protein
MANIAGRRSGSDSSRRGLSIACVYTRYHHAVDVLAGLAVAAIAAPIGYRLAREGRDSGPPRDGRDDR